MNEPETMKAVVMADIGKMRLDEIPIPVIEDDQVLIRMAYCGICGTDYDNFKGTSSFAKEGKLQLPLRWGHEWSGRICAVGKNVTSFKVGDRVITEGKITCGKCPECRAGRPWQCTRRRTVGTVGDAWPGGMAEYSVLPEKNTLKMGDHISFQQAAAMEPASIAMNGLRDIDLKGKTVLITGSGPIGLTGIPLARYFGAKRIIIAARKQAKIDIAHTLGVDDVINPTEVDLYDALREMTDGELADVVLETAGEASFVENAVRLTAIGGIFSTISFYNRPVSGLNMDDIVFNKITLTGRCGSGNCSVPLLDLIDKGLVNIDPIVTSVIDFYEYGAAVMDYYESHKATGSKTLVKIFGEDA